MDKKVLIISASPRKGGNSDLLCDQFLAGAEQTGNLVEKIILADQDIGYCVGCDYCKKHDGRCVKADDMGAILDKMIQADVIVLATPVYFYTMDAQLKALIDRTVARYTEIIGKDFYFIAAAAAGSRDALERTFEGMRGFTVCLQGAREKGIVYGTGVWAKGEVQGTPAMKQAYEMGKGV